MENKNIIYSLHRPFHKPLVTVRWVCIYMKELERKKKKIIPSSFYSDFFFYLIKILNKKYNELKVFDEIEGIPNQKTLNDVVAHFSKYSYKEKNELLRNTLADRKTNIDRKIYSTYKATSYYINLAKDKFELIDKKYQLNKSGERLSLSRSSFFALSKNEQEIIFERMLFADFYMIIPMCLSLKSAKRHKLSLSNIHLSFIEKAYKINHFKYTQTSISKNYDNVRLYWLESLDVLDKNLNLRKRYLNIILDDIEYNLKYNNMLCDFFKFEKEFLITQDKKASLFLQLENAYNNNLMRGLHDQSFVNLYDIKKEFRMSFTSFEQIVNDYYESERKKRLILFSNTVMSIDKRRRFYIRNKPVIKIKIF